MLLRAALLLSTLVCAVEANDVPSGYPPRSCRIYERCAEKVVTSAYNPSAGEGRCGDGRTDVTGLDFNDAHVDPSVPSMNCNDEANAEEALCPQYEYLLGEKISGPTCKTSSEASIDHTTGEGDNIETTTYGNIDCLMEQCDDGNTANGDGCSSDCQLEGVTYNYAFDAATTLDATLDFYAVDMSAHRDAWECLHPTTSNLTNWVPFQYSYLDQSNDGTDTVVDRFGFQWQPTSSVTDPIMAQYTVTAAFNVNEDAATQENQDLLRANILTILNLDSIADQESVADQILITAEDVVDVVDNVDVVSDTIQSIMVEITGIIYTDALRIIGHLEIEGAPYQALIPAVTDVSNEVPAVDATGIFALLTDTNDATEVSQVAIVTVPYVQDTSTVFTSTTCCYSRQCGNGVINCQYNNSLHVIEPEEACDDDNTADSDGCSSTCTIETGWNCYNGEPIVEEPSVCVREASFLTPIDEVAFLVEWYNHTHGWRNAQGWDTAVSQAGSHAQVSCLDLNKQGAAITCLDVCNQVNVEGEMRTHEYEVRGFCHEDTWNAVELSYGFQVTTTDSDLDTTETRVEIANTLYTEIKAAHDDIELSVVVVGTRYMITETIQDWPHTYNMAGGDILTFLIFDVNITTATATDAIAVNDTLTDKWLDSVFSAAELISTISFGTTYSGGNRFHINVTCNQPTDVQFVTYHKALCDTCCVDTCSNITAMIERQHSSGPVEDIAAYEDACHAYNGTQTGVGPTGSNVTLCLWTSLVIVGSADTCPFDNSATGSSPATALTNPCDEEACNAPPGIEGSAYDDDACRFAIYEYCRGSDYGADGIYGGAPGADACIPLVVEDGTEPSIEGDPCLGNPTDRGCIEHVDHIWSMEEREVLACDPQYNLTYNQSYVEVYGVDYTQVSDPCGYCTSEETCPPWYGLECGDCFEDASDQGATVRRFQGSPTPGFDEAPPASASQCHADSATSSMHLPPHTCIVWATGIDAPVDIDPLVDGVADAYVSMACPAAVQALQGVNDMTRCPEDCELHFYTTALDNVQAGNLAAECAGTPYRTLYSSALAAHETCQEDPLVAGEFVHFQCGYHLTQNGRATSDCSQLHRTILSTLDPLPSTPVGSVHVTAIDMADNGIHGTMLTYRDPVGMGPEQLQSIAALARLRRLHLPLNMITHLSFDAPIEHIMPLHGCDGNLRRPANSCDDCDPGTVFFPTTMECSYCADEEGLIRAIESDVAAYAPGNVLWCIGLHELLPLLTEIDLSYGKFANSDWTTSLRRLASLQTLRAQNNEVQGPILPYAFGSPQCEDDVSLEGGCVMPRSLSLVQLQSNLFTGAVPRSLAYMSSLTDIVIHNNHWDELGSFSPTSTLRSLTIINCDMRGTLPETLFVCPSAASSGTGGCSLVDIDLSNNRISGTIPDTIGALTTVVIISLQHNLLSGELPNTMGRLTGLRELHLRDNRLGAAGADGPASDRKEHLDGPMLDLTGGLLPLSMAYMTSLERLDLSGNSFRSREHPQSIFSRFTQLTNLDISNNHFDSLDPSIGDMEALEALDVSHNFLQHLPMSLSGLINLKYLVVSHNLLVVLPDLTMMPELLLADFSDNQIAGLIDDDPLSSTDTREKRLLFNNPLLQELYLQNNLLEVSLPPSWAMLSSLRIFDGSNNVFSVLPTDLDLMSHLQEWYMVGNILDTSLPASLASLSQLITIDLGGREEPSQVGLRGTLPAAFGLLPHVRYIDLSDNELSGTLPVEWANMRALYWLDLSSNKLSGSITPAWVHIDSMQNMDLSDNVFAGLLPADLISITYTLNLNNAGGNTGGSGGFSCPLPGGEYGAPPPDHIGPGVYCEQCLSDTSTQLGSEVSCTGVDTCITCSMRGVCQGGRDGHCVCRPEDDGTLWEGDACEHLVCPSSCSFGILNEFDEGEGSHGSCVNNDVQMRCARLGDVDMAPIDAAAIRANPAFYTALQVRYANREAQYKMDSECVAVPMNETSGSTSPVCTQNIIIDGTLIHDSQVTLTEGATGLTVVVSIDAAPNTTVERLDTPEEISDIILRTGLAITCDAITVVPTMDSTDAASPVVTMEFTVDMSAAALADESRALIQQHMKYIVDVPQGECFAMTYTLAECECTDGWTNQNCSYLPPPVYLPTPNPWIWSGPAATTSASLPTILAVALAAYMVV